MKNYEEFKITLLLSVEQVNQLAGLTRLSNAREVSKGNSGGYTECSYLQRLLSSRLGGLLSDELDYERGLKDPSTRRKFTIHTQGFAVSVELNDEQRAMVTELAALYNEYSSYRLGKQVEYSFAGEVLLSQALDYALQNGLTLDERLEHDVQHWRDNVRRAKEKAEANGEAGYLPARNPSPEEATPEEPETLSNREEETPPQLLADRTDQYFEWLEHGTAPKDSHETLIPVIDADGVQRMATLDEVEEMREAAQGIYDGAPPEPKEPEDSFRDKGYLYDPARYEGDAYECGSVVVSNPETLAFVDALLEALYRR